MCVRKGQPVIRRTWALIVWAMAWSALTTSVSAQPARQVAPTDGFESPYRISPGDELEVLVWGDERLQRTALVLPDGTFAFPLVGQIPAGGRLPSEIQTVITRGLQSQYRGQVPQVTVSVKKASGYQFSVVGKVRNPGTFTPGRYVNALEALAAAGGPTEFAQTGAIRVIRKAGGQLVVIPVRLADALRGDTSRLTSNQIPRIESGDTLVIP